MVAEAMVTDLTITIMAMIRAAMMLVAAVVAIQMAMESQISRVLI
jgi:hypothetical protein